MKILADKKITAVCRFILNSSIIDETSISSIDIVEVKAAIDSKRKNSIAKRPPLGIEENTAGNTLKTRPGPSAVIKTHCKYRCKYCQPCQ